jgi:hypothetical protein
LQASRDLQTSRGLQAERVQTKQHTRFIGVYPPGSSFCFCSIQRYPKLWWRKGNYRGEPPKSGSPSVPSANRQTARCRWREAGIIRLPSRRCEPTLYCYEISSRTRRNDQSSVAGKISKAICRPKNRQRPRDWKADVCQEAVVRLVNRRGCRQSGTFVTRLTSFLKGFS